MLAAVARALAARASSITVVAEKAAEYDDLGYRTIGDVIADKGPAGGILTALRDHGDAGDGWLLISGCDWLGLKASWIDVLAGKRAGNQLVVFRSDRLEPMLGLYHASIADGLEKCIRDGELRLQRILPRFGVAAVASPVDWSHATNVNTWSDLTDDA